MKVSYIREQIFNGKNLEELNIQVKHYLPIISKKAICTAVVDNCITEENGIFVCDFFAKEQATNIVFLTEYAGIEFDGEDDYDFLMEYGVMGYILVQIPDKEKHFIYDAIYEMIEQKMKVNNSVEVVLAKGIQKLIDKIPDEKDIKKIMNELPKMINKIKPENLQIIKEVFLQEKNKVV